MEAELIAIIVSGAVSGILLLWKFFQRIRKSRCYIETNDGQKIEIDFNAIEKVIENEAHKQLTPKQKETLKRIAEKVIQKNL